MDAHTARETERLIQLEQAQIRRLESIREELNLYAQEAVRTRKRREALQKGQSIEDERLNDYVKAYY